MSLSRVSKTRARQLCEARWAWRAVGVCVFQFGSVFQSRLDVLRALRYQLAMSEFLSRFVKTLRWTPKVAQTKLLGVPRQHLSRRKYFSVSQNGGPRLWRSVCTCHEHRSHRTRDQSGELGRPDIILKSDGEPSCISTPGLREARSAVTMSQNNLVVSHGSNEVVERVIQEVTGLILCLGITIKAEVIRSWLVLLGMRLGYSRVDSATTWNTTTQNHSTTRNSTTTNHSTTNHNHSNATYNHSTTTHNTCCGCNPQPLMWLWVSWLRGCCGCGLWKKGGKEKKCSKPVFVETVAFYKENGS